MGSTQTWLTFAHPVIMLKDHLHLVLHYLLSAHHRLSVIGPSLGYSSHHRSRYFYVVSNIIH